MDFGFSVEAGRVSNLFHWEVAPGRIRLRVAHCSWIRRNESGWTLSFECLTYGDAEWFPSMSPELRAEFNRITKGILSGNAGEKAPEKGVVGIPFLDEYIEKAASEYLDKAGNSGKPFFMSVNFMKVHQPNLPHPPFIHKSPAKTKYADSIVENDARIGHILDKLRQMGWIRTRMFFGRQIMAPGKTFTPTPVTHLSGERKAPRRWKPRSSRRGALGSSPVPEITTSLAAWTLWPPSQLSVASLYPIKISRESP